MTASNNGATWTPEMDQQLIDLMKAGTSMVEVANACGRTVPALIARVDYIISTKVRFEQARRLIVEHL